MAEPRDAVTVTITPRVRNVLLLADRIARRHDHDFVGTEHLLLAIIEDADGIAGQVLTALGAAIPARARTEGMISDASYVGAPGPPAPASPPPLRLSVPVAAG